MFDSHDNCASLKHVSLRQAIVGNYDNFAEDNLQKRVAVLLDLLNKC
jgi:hypothetical protein